MCEERDFSVRNPHRRGQYLHRHKHPCSDDTMFVHSNPAPFVWESYARVLKMIGLHYALFIIILRRRTQALNQLREIGVVPLEFSSIL